MRIFPLGVWAVSTSGETTSFLVDAGSTRLMLDVGLNPGHSLATHAIPLTTVTHVFLSHSHSDHMQGFANLVFTRDAQQRQHGPAPRLNVIACSADLGRAQSLLEIFYPERKFDVDWTAVAPGSTIGLNDFEMTFFATEHTVPGLGAVLARNSSKLVVYTSDTAACDSVREAAEGAHLLVGECFGTRQDFGAVAERLKHMCAEDMAELAQSAGVLRVMPFHMHTPYTASDRRADLINAIAARFSGEILDPVPSRPIEVHSEGAGDD
ncbi:MBL fold metallo-hydrolase [Streptomyces sp. NPDC101169]|uniref:MBL fold metallo-hydrolase n=1 Tax=Streptomyces sp. NPDC101169 TaxID=3366121 RepID=UPI00382FFCF0